MKSIRILLVLGALGAASFGCGKKTEDGIRFRYWGDSAEINIIQQSIRDFEAANPGIKVYAERKAPDANYGALLTSEFAAGTAPDVIFIGDLNCDSLIEGGRFLALEPFLKGDKEVRKSDYYAAMVKRFSRGGKLYLLPRDIAPVNCVFYNKALFDKAKVAYPKDSWNWSDFKAKAIKLTDKNAAGGPQFGFAEDNSNIEPYAFSSGATLVDDNNKPGRITLDSARALRGLRFRMELMHKLKVIPSGADTTSLSMGPEGMFLSGKAAMFYSGIWKTPGFRKIKDFDWDVAPFPAGPDGHRHTLIAGSGYGIASTSKKAAEAWKLVRYLGGPEGQKKLATTGLAQPAIKALAESKVFLDGQRPLNKKMLLKSAELGYTSPALGRWQEFYDGIWRPNYDLIWVPGFQDDEEAIVKKAVAKGNELLFGKK